MAGLKRDIISSHTGAWHLRCLTALSCVVQIAVFLAVGALSLMPVESLARELLNRNVDWTGETLRGVPCYGQGVGYGPYDYVTEKADIEIVERAHFTAKMERLEADRYGRKKGIGSSLDYTLRAVPNHHRALWAMARLYLQKLKYEDPRQLEKLENAQTGNPPPECYFQRAKAFKPSDGMVSAVFGIYLHKRKMLEPALAEYVLAEQKMPGHSEVAYNMGLLYLDLGDLEKAQEYATRATELGYPLEGLQRRINQRMQEAEDG